MSSVHISMCAATTDAAAFLFKWIQTQRRGDDFPHNVWADNDFALCVFLLTLMDNT